MTTHAVPHMTPRQHPIDLSHCEIPHPKPFVCDLRVSPHELSGTIEHVSNIEYVRWLDRAAELHSDTVGYTRKSLLSQSVMWFVARHEIDYLGETWRDDELVIATWVRSFRRVKSWRDYVITRPADETIVCRAATLWVLVDLPTRRPTRISPDMLSRFDPLAKSSSPQPDTSCTSP